MNEDQIIMFVKIFSINILTFIVNYKIVSKNIKFRKISMLVICSALITIVYEILSKYIDNMLKIIIMYLLQLAILKLEMKDRKDNMIVMNLIANAIVYIFFGISALMELPLMLMLRINNKIINSAIVSCIETLIIIGFFNVKRFKKGFIFLREKINNEYASIIMINISAIAILAYYLYGNYYGILTTQLIICFVITGSIMIVLIQKTLTLYYKQKLLAQNIEEYKAEIASKDAEIKSLSEEKYKISKLNHEFYNRQKALIHKVEEIININTEVAEELDLSKQINDLTK